MGAVAIPYHLNEEQGWTLQVEELERALEAAKGLCNPVALYVINPGNPAGIAQCSQHGGSLSGEFLYFKNDRFVFCSHHVTIQVTFRAESQWKK